jgi:hypothetical protein
MTEDRLSQVRNPGEPDLPSEIIDAEFDPPSSEPIRLETDGVFDSAGYPLPLEAMMGDEFFDNPTGPLMKMLGRYLDSIKPPMAFTTPPRAEHKVRIFLLDGAADLQAIEGAIEGYLNDGYCSHMPTVVNDFVIMDFSRRKETEEG